jgi:hypothetical protein
MNFDLSKVLNRFKQKWTKELNAVAIECIGINPLPKSPRIREAARIRVNEVPAIYPPVER